MDSSSWDRCIADLYGVREYSLHDLGLLLYVVVVWYYLTRWDPPLPQIRATDHAPLGWDEKLTGEEHGMEAQWKMRSSVAFRLSRPVWW